MTARPASGSAAMGAAAKRGRVRCSAQMHTLERCSDGAVRWTAVQTTGRRPAPRGEHGAAAAGGKLFVFGGQKLSRPKGADGRGGGGGGGRGRGRAGGAKAAAADAASGTVARASSELFVLDPITLSWSQVARTPPLRREAGTLVGLGDKFLLAFGGWSGHYSPVDARLQPWSDALHALHLPTRRWFQLAAPGPAPVGRYGHA